MWTSSASALRHVEVGFSCGAITYSFSGFPANKENTVSELVRSGGQILVSEKFTFTGSTGANTVKIALGSGHHLVKAESHWNTNGVIGESGKHRERLECAAPNAAFAIQKLQAIAGSEKAFSAAELLGKTGQTLDYEIVVSNTGNLPLVLEKFSDPECEAETLAGGQGETPLLPGEQTVYTCSRKLTDSGTYENVVRVTATPEEGGEAKTQESNKVVAKVPPKAAFEATKLQEIAGSNAGFTSSTLSASVGQTVDYEIIVKNTGNVALVFSEFTDVYCDPGTIGGGSGSSAVAPGASTTYTCTRKLTEATNYENVASLAGTAVGSTQKNTVATNTVKVKSSAALPAAGGGTSPSTSSSTPSSGTPTTPGTTTGKPTGSGEVLGTKESKKKHKKRKPHTTAHRTPRFTG